MPYSHHSHSGQFCKHASGTLEDVVLEAINQRFELYGLTEHVARYREADLYPEEAGMSLKALSEQSEQFVDEAQRLKRKYADRISLLVGLETEFISEIDLVALSKSLTSLDGRVEYLVGSVHHVNEIPIDFDQQTFQKCLQTFCSDGEDESQAIGKFLVSYLDSQYELLRRFHPEVIGHVDLCRLYNPRLRFADYPDALQKLERNLKFAADYGALFEANAAPYRKGWDTAYPGSDVVQLILNYNGQFTLSDDSHGPHMVGMNYHRLAQYLWDVGVRELWHLEHSEVMNIGRRYVKPVKMRGNWWKHSFWTSRTSFADADPNVG